MHEIVLLSCQTCNVPSVYQSLSKTDFLFLNHMIRQIFCYDLRKGDLHREREICTKSIPKSIMDDLILP